MTFPHSLTFASTVKPMYKRVRLIVGLVILSHVLPFIGFSQSGAGDSCIVAGFEIDADYPWDANDYNCTTDAVTNGTDDWDTALNLGITCGTTTYNDPDPNIGQATWQLDARWNGSNKDPSSFGGGSNKNDDLIGPGQSVWTTTNGSGPQKNDLTNIFFHTRVDGDGDRWFIFGAETLDQ